MTMTAARSFDSINGRQGQVLLFLVLLSLVVSPPVFGFGLGLQARRRSNRILPRLYLSTKDNNNSKETSTNQTAAAKTARQSQNKKGKPKLSTQKPAKEGISHLANDANLCSKIVDNPTWDQNIAALLEYNQTHGTVNLPQYSKEYPNLGQWIYNLRQNTGHLTGTKEQIQQLNDIGFLWKDSLKDKQDKKWHEMFMSLQAYKEKYGDCLVSTLDESHKELGNWVSKQRTYYKNKQRPLSTDRIEKLESIGFVWSLRKMRPPKSTLRDKRWKEKYQELIEFKEEHNHTNVPRDYPQNKGLASWVHRQRTHKKDGILRGDRQDDLRKIGFILEFDGIWEESWLEQYEELKKYYQDLTSYQEMAENNPEGSVAVRKPLLGEQLSHWASAQRRLHANGELDPQRKGMLDEIGFEWRE